MYKTIITEIGYDIIIPIIAWFSKENINLKNYKQFLAQLDVMANEVIKIILKKKNCIFRHF